jgi:putative copper export protein/methionine-rich copper-binding protein CopC
MKVFNKTAFVLVLFFIVFGFEVSSKKVSAHANLLRSIPASLEELQSSPERLIIWFTEPVDADFCSIKIFNEVGDSMPTGGIQQDLTEPTVLWTEISELPKGVYTVLWKNLSSVDGHRVVGSYVFSVGNPLSEKTTSKFESQPLLQSNFDPVLRWISYIGISIILGGVIFEVLVLNILQTKNKLSPKTKVSIFRSTIIFGRFTFLAALFLVFAQVGFLFQQVSLISDDFQFVLVSTLLMGGDWGLMWMVLFISSILLFGITAYLVFNVDIGRVYFSVSSSSQISIFCLLILGLIYVMAKSLSGHSAAVPDNLRLLSITANFFHAIAAAVWIGGLSFMTVLHSRVFLDNGGKGIKEILRPVTTSFSFLGLTSFITLIASGVFLWVMQISTFKGMRSPYGAAFITKMCLVLLLTILAFINGFVLTDKVIKNFRKLGILLKLVRIEIFVGLTIFLVVGLMASLEPGGQYASRVLKSSDVLNFRATEDGISYDASMVPSKPGINHLTLSIDYSRNNKANNIIDVRARFRYLAEEFNEPMVSLIKKKNGLWVLNDINLSISGDYRIDVVIRRSDGFDVRGTHNFTLSSRESRSSPKFFDSLYIFGIILVSSAAILILINLGIKKLKPKLDKVLTTKWTMISCSVLILVGFTVILGAFINDKESPSVNPVAMTSTSIQSGKGTYFDRCSSCHGDSGRGDGFLAGSTVNTPSDLGVHVPIHTDSELYKFIYYGIPESGMPAQNSLSVEEIWNLVNYLRSVTE